MSKSSRATLRWALFIASAAAFAQAPGSSPDRPTANNGGKQGAVLQVGVAGSEPFVVTSGTGIEGISVEVWQAIAAQAGIRYQLRAYRDVPEALAALNSGAISLVAGPVSITADRAAKFRFSQPYFQSSLAILSRSNGPSLWQRIAPFFSESFFIAVGVLLFVLAVVGTLIWMAERRVTEDQFPRNPAAGIANGIWLAVVTMTTVGYGDRAPRTFLGRLVTGAWMVVSVITASSLIAGIASTLTLTGMRSSTVSTAEQLGGRRVAAVVGSPGETFARSYGAQVIRITSLQQGYEQVARRSADAFVFDRPQLLYSLRKQHDPGLAVSKAEYMRQSYGFAFPLSSPLVHTVNMNLLRLEESGRVDRIVRAWLGDDAQD